jgi:sugar-specific transcriptional regulator TrmB
MSASDVSRKAKIPGGRVYGVLKTLAERGFVRKRGPRPASFDAMSPRSVVMGELGKINDGAKDAVAKAEGEWETRRSQREERLKNCWTVEELSGFAREVQSGIKGAKESVYVLDPDVTWVTAQEMKEIREAQKRNVKFHVVSSPRSGDSLKDLVDLGIQARAQNAGEESFYVFDGARVVVRLHNPEGATVFEDRPFAQILIRHYTDAESKSAPVQ